MIGLGPRCIYCKHYSKEMPGTCRAFPEDIPAEFFLGETEHVTPYEGDHGIQFELNPSLSPDAVRRYKKRFENTDR